MAPTMVKTPLSPPATSAISSAPACQSPAITDQRFDAAPVPMGKRQMKIASSPILRVARVSTSRPASFRLVR